MVAVQAIYDGKEFKPLPSESFPDVNGEVPVMIVFSEDVAVENGAEKSQQEIIEEMWAVRAKMQLLGMSISEMIEEGRER
jgi:hypothetical protein